MVLEILEQRHNDIIKNLKEKQLTVQIYKSRKPKIEPDLLYQAVDPRNQDYLLYSEDTLPKVMTWCEQQGLSYKFLPNSGNHYL